MSSIATTPAHPETGEQSLPNKFVYPEFAGFAGEALLHEIVTLILPISLLRTWEIFERKHAYDNDCYQSLGTVAKKASRTQRTINRHIATFLARGLLVLRPGYKLQSRSDGSTFKKAIVIKDFSGLYDLAHEYYLWQCSEEYLAPEYEYVELIRHDPHLQAKLWRFEDYRRLLEHQRDPFAQVQEDRRFTEYQAAPSLQGDGDAKDAKENQSGSNTTLPLPKEQSKGVPKVSQKRINESPSFKRLNGDSFDSGPNQEVGEADAGSNMCSQKRVPGAEDYTKPGEKRDSHNESKTNPVPSTHKNVPPGAGKTCESDEMHLDVLQAKQAMAAAGFASGRSVRHQDKMELLLPQKHPLARSFVHEVAGVFGDLNEKGSKTGIERSIETYQMKPGDVLLCLVRAYVVARDMKMEKIRYRRPDGVVNRMPLFCSMFKKFAQALGPGSCWQYTWEQMVEDIKADERLNLWVLEHQAALAGGEGNQADVAQPVPSTLLGCAEELAEEELAEFDGNKENDKQEIASETSSGVDAPEIPDEGWQWREEACACADYLASQLAIAGYGGTTIKVQLPKGGTRYQVFVFPEQGEGYRLVCEEDVTAAVDLAHQRLLFVGPDGRQAAAVD